MCSIERFVCCHFTFVVAEEKFMSAPFSVAFFADERMNERHNQFQQQNLSANHCIVGNERGNQNESYFWRHVKSSKRHQTIYRLQFPFIVSSINSTYPSTLVNISGSPIVSHDSYPLLTTPTSFFLPFLNTTNACPESPEMESTLVHPQQQSTKKKPEQVDAPMPRPQITRSEYSVKFLGKKFWHSLSEMISYRAQFGVIVVGPAEESTWLIAKAFATLTIPLTITKFSVSRDDSLQPNETSANFKALRQRNSHKSCWKPTQVSTQP